MDAINVATNLLKDQINENSNEIDKNIRNESSKCIKCMLIKQKMFFIFILAITIFALTVINLLFNMIMNQEISEKIFKIMNSKFNNSLIPYKI